MTLTDATVSIGDHTGLHAIRGLSVAGWETCIHVPKYDVLFDIGRCPEWAVSVQNVFVSHGHTDHAGGLHFHSSLRALQGMAPPRYFVPEEIDTLVSGALRHQVVLDGGGKPRALVTDLGPGKGAFHLRRDVHVQSFATDHRVPSQGYLVLGLKKLVQPNFAGLQGWEYAELRKKGIPFEYEAAIPMVAFSGDTRIEGLFTDARVPEAELLICECSFVDGTVEEAREKGHIHLDELVLALREGKLRNRHILLTHFSKRYTRDQILTALDAKVPTPLRDRVTPLLNT